MEDEQQSESWSFEAVPSDAVRLYKLLWQLESWLRVMVYVELRAAECDWEASVRQRVNNWPPVSLERDKRLHHMATPHQASLSYLTLSDTWNVISTPSNWPLFQDYFPPRENVASRIEEVKAIRNRIAHFRDPHENDVVRLKLFLADMEKGVKLFCSRYSVPIHVENDALAQALESAWERTGYGVELMRPDFGWLYAPHPRRQQPIVNARLCALQMRGRDSLPASGLVYRMSVSASNLKKLDAVYLLTSMTVQHPHVIHIMPSNHEVTMTLPAVLGMDRLLEVISAFLRAAVDSVTSVDRNRLTHVRSAFPEYVLWPDHVLAYYSGDFAEPVFDTN